MSSNDWTLLAQAFGRRPVTDNIKSRVQPQASQCVVYNARCFSKVHLILRLFPVNIILPLLRILSIIRHQPLYGGRSTAARLLRLWVRIPPGTQTFVCCECCVVPGRGLCDELITRPEESYRLWRVVVCDLETSKEEAKPR